MKKWNRMNHQFRIRKEALEDAEEIQYVVQEAFGRQNEAKFVTTMREAKKTVVSLVAIHEQQLVGHILFSEVNITPSPNGFSGVALGPIAVLPSFQRKGIGSHLIHAGLTACRKVNSDVAVVYGSDYYARRSFLSASDYNLLCDGNIEHFWAMELREGALREIRGSWIAYQPEFRIMST